MLPCKHPVALLSLAVLLTSLTACTNTPAAKNLEKSLAADPRLQENPDVFGEDSQKKPQPTQNEPTVQLPADFPQEIPLYQNAKLQEVTPASGTENKVSTRWLSSDPSNFITSFYRSQLQNNNWQILQQPADDVGTFAARRNDLLIKVSIQAQSVTNPAPDQPQTATNLVIEYTPNSTETAQSPSTTNNTPQPGDPQSVAPANSNTTANTPTNTATIPTSGEFSDLNKAPQELRQHIQDLAGLGVLSVESPENKANSNSTNLFEPSKIITRRMYARWLVAANNAVFANNSAKKIRLAAESTQPAFSDVSKSDPDFSVIQGLAEAGLIPSPLSGDSIAVLFRPDAPLTREQMILWKVPLDTRQALPTANLDTVQQTWGFQDAAKIEPKAWRAVLADFQNAEKSNIRRVFGYTTLFQPKKPVTRAEAAAALWYFGTSDDGVSAADAVKLKRSPT